MVMMVTQHSKHKKNWSVHFKVVTITLSETYRSNKKILFKEVKSVHISGKDSN